MTWTILRRFPDWEEARSLAIRLVTSDDKAGWQEVWCSQEGHIVKVEEHPAGIGIIYYRNGDADVYQGQFLPPSGAT